MAFRSLWYGESIYLELTTIPFANVNGPEHTSTNQLKPILIQYVLTSRCRIGSSLAREGAESSLSVRFEPFKLL